MRTKSERTTREERDESRYAILFWNRSDDYE